MYNVLLLKNPDAGFSLAKMYNFGAPLFWFKFIFLAEVIVAEILIAYRMKRKAGFVRRLIIAAFSLLCFTFALPVPFYNAIYTSALFMVIFIATLGALKFCLDEPWGNIIYCGFFSYTEQHVSFQCYNIFCLLLNLNSNNIYGGGEGEFSWLKLFVFVVPHIAVYLICWALLAYRSHRRESGIILHNVKVFVIAIVIVFVNVSLNAFVVYDLPANTSAFVNFIIIFYNIFSCILALVMLVSIVGQEGLEFELKFVKNLWRKNEQIYELSKTNIDFINMKCHDLRHRIRHARKRDTMDENELEEIEKAIDIYDSILKTGNQALDIILSEESIFCNKNNIKLLCNIDGTQLKFMNEADLYAIFQNAIHNAIDAVMKVEELDKRVIRLNIKRINNIVSVHIENYAVNADSIRFENGLPVSESKVKDMHGFGMRSMKMAVEKYGGNIGVDVRDGIFHLNMIIPVPSDLTTDRTNATKGGNG